MISYCIAAFRPTYAMLLIEDLIRKTSVPYEILVWVNSADPAFLLFLEEKKKARIPIEVVGVTPENIGMNAFKTLFQRAKYEIITQMDDDVIRISRNIPQRCLEIFRQHPNIDQVVADVWQDDYTNGARPEMSVYKTVSAKDGLFDGPIDGWWSMYRKSLLPTLMEAPYDRYVYLGSWVRGILLSKSLLGVLCAKMKVFHVIGPIYASLFGMLDFERDKYRNLGRTELADIYEGAKKTLPSPMLLAQARDRAYLSLDRFGA